MAIFARVLTLALLSTLASGLDKWGLFCCPANQRDKADSSVSYANPLAIGELSLKFLTGGPYTVVAAAESEEARRFSCITMTPLLNVFSISYYYNGVSKVVSLTWDPLAAELKGRLPKGLLNSPADNVDVQFTVTSYKDGFVVLKTCKSGILSQWVATYILIDKTVDRTAVNTDCVASVYDVKCKIETWPKGICMSGSTGKGVIGIITGG